MTFLLVALIVRRLSAPQQQYRHGSQKFKILHKSFFSHRQPANLSYNRGTRTRLVQSGMRNSAAPALLVLVLLPLCPRRVLMTWDRA